MVVTFCGHAKFCKTKEYEQQIRAFLEEKVGEQAADMYLGGYGNFDIGIGAVLCLFCYTKRKGREFHDLF